MNNEEYGRKIVPFVDIEWFKDDKTKIIFKHVKEYFNKYNSFPSKEALTITLQGNKDILEEIDHDLVKTVETMFEEGPAEKLDWLLDETERYCKNQAVFKTLVECLEIAKEEHETFDVNAIPSLWQKTLAIGLNPDTGHDYVEDYEERWDSSREVEEKIRSDLDTINKITNGGFSKKTLSALLGASGKGKSIWLCHTAAAALAMNYNVVYITLELSDKKVAERIDANLLDVSVADLRKMPKQAYVSRMQNLTKNVLGKLFVKEYPIGVSSAANFSAYLQELKTKKNFTPDLIIVDYLNLCASSRIKRGGAGSYEYIKSIAEELRCLAFQQNVAMLTATQFNRAGAQSSDPEMEGVADSYGLPYTLDLFLAFTTNDELEKDNLIVVKQLKNRDNDDSTLRRFMLKMDKPKMKMSDVDDRLQQRLNDTNNNLDDDGNEEEIKTIEKQLGLKAKVSSWVTE